MADADAEALALCTDNILIGTSITPIYTRNVNDFAQTVGFIHEVSNGRFRFGIGVSHAPAMSRIGVTARDGFLAGVSLISAFRRTDYLAAHRSAGSPSRTSQDDGSRWF